MCDDSVRVFLSDSVEDITFTKTFLHLLEPDNSSRNSCDSFSVAIIENDILLRVGYSFWHCLTAAATPWTAAYPTNSCPFLVIKAGAHMAS